MEGDSAAVAGIVALGAVALLGVLFYILFIGQSQDVAHLHADVIALDNATPASAPAATSPTTASPSPTTASPPAAAPARPTLRPAPPVPVTAPGTTVTGVPVTTQLGGVSIPGTDTTRDPRLSQETIELLLKDIVNGNGAGYAPLLEMILSREDPGAVQGAISPLFNDGTNAGANVDALSALTTALRTGATPPASAGSGLSTNLMVMYEMLVDSLASSSMLSDTTRGLLDTIKSKKCEIKFASEPDKLKTCLVVAMERPATAATPTPATVPAKQETVAVRGKNYIRADGLITNVDGVDVTFDFSKRQLSSCDSGGCSTTPLIKDPSRDYSVPAAKTA
jgi:hypothetical protein